MSEFTEGRPYYDEFHMSPEAVERFEQSMEEPPEAEETVDSPPDVPAPEEEDTDISLYDLESRMTQINTHDLGKLVKALDADERHEQGPELHHGGAKQLFNTIRGLEPNERHHLLTTLVDQLEHGNEWENQYAQPNPDTQTLKLAQGMLERTAQQIAQQEPAHPPAAPTRAAAPAPTPAFRETHQNIDTAKPYEPPQSEPLVLEDKPPLPPHPTPAIEPLPIGQDIEVHRIAPDHAYDRPDAGPLELKDPERVFVPFQDDTKQLPPPVVPPAPSAARKIEDIWNTPATPPDATAQHDTPLTPQSQPSTHQMPTWGAATEDFSPDELPDYIREFRQSSEQPLTTPILATPPQTPEPAPWPPVNQHPEDLHVRAEDIIPTEVEIDSEPDKSKPNGTDFHSIPLQSEPKIDAEPDEPAASTPEAATPTVEIPHPFEPKKYAADDSTDLPAAFDVSHEPTELPESLTNPLSSSETAETIHSDLPGGPLIAGGRRNPDEKEIITEPRHATPPSEPRGERGTTPEAESAIPTPEAVAARLADAEKKISTLSEQVKAEFLKEPEGPGSKLSQFFSKQPHLREYVGVGLSGLSLVAQLSGFGPTGEIARVGRTILGMWNYTNLSTKIGMERKLSHELPGIFENTEALIDKLETEGKLSSDEYRTLEDLLGRQLSFYKQGVDVDKHHQRFENAKSGKSAEETTEKKGIKEWLKKPETKETLKKVGWYSSPLVASLIAPVFAPAAVVATGLMVATTATSLKEQIGRARDAKEKAKADAAAEELDNKYESTQLSQYIKKIEHYKAGTDAETMTKTQQEFTNDFAEGMREFSDIESQQSKYQRIQAGAVGFIGSGLFYAFMHEATHSDQAPQQQETQPIQATAPEQQPHVAPAEAPTTEPTHTPDATAPATPPAEHEPTPSEPATPTPEATKTGPPPLPDADTTPADVPAGAPELAPTQDMEPGTAAATTPETPSSEPKIFTEDGKSFIKLDLGLESGPEKCEVIKHPDGSQSVLVQWADIYGRNGVADHMNDHAVRIDIDKGDPIDVSNKFGYIVSRENPDKLVESFDGGSAHYTESKDAAMIAQFSRKEDVVKKLIEDQGGNWEETKARLNIDTSRHDWHDMVARTGVMAAVDGLSPDPNIPDMQVHRAGDELFGNWHGLDITFAPTQAPLSAEQIAAKADHDPALAQQIANSAFAFADGSLRPERINFEGTPDEAAESFLRRLTETGDLLPADTTKELRDLMDTPAERDAFKNTLTDLIEKSPSRSLSFDEMLKQLKITPAERLLKDIPTNAPELAPQGLDQQLNRLMRENAHSPWRIALTSVKEGLAHVRDSIESVRLVSQKIDGADVLVLNLKGGLTKQYLFPPNTHLENLIPKGGK